MANGYASDPIKEKARIEIYKFADAHLPRDRSQANALYLASDNDRESLLLDKLGIPRANRVILEGDKDKVGAVRRANPEILVLPMTTTEFFTEEAKNSRYGPFWYCGLDYESMLGTFDSIDLRNIAKDYLLKDGGVIYTNFVTNREGYDKKEAYLLLLISNFFNISLFKDISNFHLSPMEEIRRIEAKLKEEGDYSDEKATERFFQEAIRGVSPEGLNRLRGVAIREVIQQFLCLSPSPPVFCIDNCTPSHINLLADICRREGISLEEAERSLSLFDPYERGDFRRDLKDVVNSVHSLPKILCESGESPFEIKCLRYSLEPKTVAYYQKGGIELLAVLIDHAFTEGYVPGDWRSYVYISQANTQMMLDIMQVHRINPVVTTTLDDLFSKQMDVYYTRQRPYLGKMSMINIYTKNKRDGMNALRKSTLSVQNYLEERIGQLRNLLFICPTSEHKRISLGSAFKPPLTRALARKCVIKGMTNEEIEERYQVKDWKRVGAIRRRLAEGTLKGIQKDEPKKGVVKKEGRKKGAYELPQHLLPSRVYRTLPDEVQKRMGYFEEEALEPLHHIRRKNIRKAFADSDLADLVDPEMSPVRHYAFFDDVSVAINRGEKVTSEFLDRTYKQVRDADTLTPVVTYSQEKSRNRKSNGITDELKQEILGLLEAGFPRDEIWEAYEDRFSSKSQFSAVIRWLLDRKSKTTSE